MLVVLRRLGARNNKTYRTMSVDAHKEVMAREGPEVSRSQTPDNIGLHGRIFPGRLVGEDNRVVVLIK